MCSSDLTEYIKLYPGTKEMLKELKKAGKNVYLLSNAQRIFTAYEKAVITVKINNYVEDLKAKSAAELNNELVAAKKELFNLRFQNATNQLDNTARIKEVRKNIARIQTVIAQKNA